MIPLLLLTALAPAADLETSARRAVIEQFERVGRSTPALDPALTRAARVLAQRAIDGSAADAAELLTLTAAVSEAGGYDATPRALVLRGSPTSEAMLALGKRDDLTAEPATHVGIGAVKRGDVAALVLLFTERRLLLAPMGRLFARRPPPQPLCAQLLEPLKSADVFVTRPGGQVDKYPTREEKGAWCATIDFPSEGRHTLEVLARGERGPQVAALFFVQVGAVASKDTPLAEREPATLEEARARVLLRINALRKANAVPALARDFELDSIAQAYAERLAGENFFAHVAPDGEDLKARMRRAGYRYTNAGENLGLANGALAAHFSIEHSPGHRKNLLDPGYTRAGVGSAKNSIGQTLVVEVLANPAMARVDEDPAVEANQALAEARKSRGLAPLIRSAVLDQLATAHARRALELDTPKSRLPGENLHDRVFAARDDLKSTSVDFFVTDSPALVIDSKNLFDPKATLVGIGVVKGDSATYGTAKFWLVIIYASTLE
jgi:uncharacterized protein YkwD